MATIIGGVFAPVAVIIAFFGLRAQYSQIQDQIASQQQQAAEDKQRFQAQMDNQQKQLDHLGKALRTTVYQTLSGWTIDVDKAFIEHPELRPFFYEGERIEPAHPQYARAVAIAEYLLDTFDSTLELGDYFPGGAPNEGWLNWIRDTFSKSPLLCEYLDKEKRWYEHGPIYPFYLQWKQENARAARAN